MTGHCNLNCPSETFSMATRNDLARFDDGFKGLTNRTSLLAIQRVARIAQLDVGREIRKGLPEISLAEGKASQEVAEIVEAMVKRTGRAIVSRATRKHLRPIRARRIPKSRIQFFERSGIILAKLESYRVKQTGGRVGLLTAGTSDIPVAEEAQMIAEELGCKTRVYYDVGVAGLHRLFKPLSELLKWDSDVILVVAGREGALPTVVAGLVDVPVIGVPLMDRQGRVTSHLSGLLYRTTNLAERRIRLVYVFDGVPPALKETEIKRRRAVKEEATVKYEAAISRGEVEEAKKYAQATASLKDMMVEDAHRLLEYLGVPYVQAPSEGEAQAAYMAARGDVWAAVSQDYDSLLFGATRLVRNLAISGKRKLPMREAYVQVDPEIIELASTLESLGLMKEQLIDLGILIGTDFNPDGFKGIGPKTALKLLRENATIEGIAQKK